MKGSNKIRKPGLIDREALGRIFSASEITDYRLKKSQEEINKVLQDIDAQLEAVNNLQDLDLSGLGTNISTLQTKVQGLENREIPRIAKGTSDTTITIDPNKFYVWGEVDSLTITLGTADTARYQEYMFQFDSGSTPTTLTLPSSVKWPATPEIEANCTYQISILENIGSIIAVENV